MIKQMINMVAKRRPIFIEQKIVSPEKEFGERKILIIGGGSGIGAAIANELYLSGATIIICGRKKHEDKYFSSEVWDVSEIDKIGEKLSEIIKKYGPIDSVVNSQGICPKCDFEKKINLVDTKDFDEVIRVNLESVYFICQKACEYFEKNGIAGHVLNICSTEGLKGAVVPYGISKAGVISLTEGFGKYYASKGITVNGIAPGATSTQMMGMKSEGDLRINYIPSRRATTPTEIAKMAKLLLSDSGKQICGSIVTVDGGESLH